MRNAPVSSTVNDCARGSFPPPPPPPAGAGGGGGGLLTMTLVCLKVSTIPLVV